MTQTTSAEAILEKMRKEYQYYLYMAGMKAKAENYIPLGALAGILAGTLSYLAITTLALPVSPILALVIAFMVSDLILGYPYLKTQQKIEQIEAAFPEALKQMADTLKTGGTYEFALREVATAEYGALTDEMNLALRRLNEGENLENALAAMSENIHSKNVQRVITIIIDSVKAGAGLADILDEISEDVRQMNRVNRERKSQTLMQVLFLFFAGAVIAPVILGVITSVVELLINAGQSFNLSPDQLAAAFSARDTIFNLLQFYLFVEILATSILVALMRDGKIAKGILYGPVFLFIGFVSYYLGLVLARSIMGLG